VSAVRHGAACELDALLNGTMTPPCFSRILSSLVCNGWETDWPLTLSGSGQGHLATGRARQGPEPDSVGVNGARARLEASRGRGITPLGAIARGVGAGAVGTAAVDLIWFGRHRRGGGTSNLVDWEFSKGLDDWEAAPAPVQVGRRLVEGFLQRELNPDKAALTNNATHWGYGLLWGALYGILAGSLRSARVRYGAIFGPLVWASAHAVLPAAGLYKPMWEYDAKTLGKDLSAHLGYGLGTAAAFRALARG